MKVYTIHGLNHIGQAVTWTQEDGKAAAIARAKEILRENKIVERVNVSRAGSAIWTAP